MERLFERFTLAGAFHRGGILDPPMRIHRLARPDRAGLAGGIVADGEDEIEDRGTGGGKLVPALRAKALGLEAEFAEKRAHLRMDLTLGDAAGAKGAKASRAIAVQQRLGEDRARAVAGAQEQHVINLVSHENLRSGGSRRSAAGKFGEKWFAKFGAALATVLRKEEHQTAQRVDVGSLYLLPPKLLGLYETGFGEHGEMRREGALRETRCVNKLPGRQAFRLMPGEQAEGLETRRMSEGGESGKRGVNVHASELSDVFHSVKSHRENPIRRGTLFFLRPERPTKQGGPP